MRKNSLIQEFIARLDARFADDSEKMAMSAWIEANTHLRKKPFSFKGYEFQRQIANDMHPSLVCIKPSQIGLTEVQLRKFFGFLKRTTAINGIFTLPDDAMYKRVSQTRAKPLVDSEPVFNMGQVEKPIRSMSLYQIDQSFGFFTGNKESDATSINADFIFNDEVDLSDQEMLALFNSRLQGSDLRIRQGFSTPTFEGYGIDAEYKASDQHEYLCRCGGCGHWNLPLFNPKFVHLPGLSADINDLSEIDVDIAAGLDFSQAYVCCEQCRRPLDLGNPSLREWVPKHPGRLSRGYWVRPFSTDRLGIEYIVQQLLEYKRKHSLRRWYNTVLGEPFNDSSARLSPEDILAVMRGDSKIEVGSDQPVFVGIDVGQICHIVAAHVGHGMPVVFLWKQVHESTLLAEVEALMSAYRVVGGGMDRNPYTPLARDVMEASQGLIVPIEYGTSASAPPMVLQHDELGEFTHVRSNRTQIIDEVARAVRKRRVAFHGYGRLEPVILQHLQDMVRIEKAEEAASWNKLTGEDHFFHALGFLFHAMRLKDALLFRSDADTRVMSDVIGIMTANQSGASLGVRERSRTLLSIGSQAA